MTTLLTFARGSLSLAIMIAFVGSVLFDLVLKGLIAIQKDLSSRIERA